MSDEFKEYFNGSFIISQNDVSVHFSESKAIHLHRMIDGKPKTVVCTIGNLIKPHFNKLENDSENAESKSSLTGVFKTS